MVKEKYRETTDVKKLMTWPAWGIERNRPFQVCKENPCQKIWTGQILGEARQVHEDDIRMCTVLTPESQVICMTCSLCQGGSEIRAEND